MKMIVSGGGTGGHIYPALAVAQAIRARISEAEILYVGTEKGLEREIVPRTGFDFRSIQVEGLNRSSLMKASRSLARLPASFGQAWEIVKKFQPDIVLGTGGYVSFPVVLSATFIPCRTFIHEQNAFPGLANRILARRVDCTMLTFAEAAQNLNARQIRVTGLPVREEILSVRPEPARLSLKLREGTFTVIIFGGSRGALSINNAVCQALPRLRELPINMIWITGEGHFADMQERVKQEIDGNKTSLNLIVQPYIFNMAQALAAADLAICRSGASTLSELAILGLPALLIPYPYATDNHQEKNARALADKGAAWLVIDEFFDGDTLYQNLVKLMNNRDTLAAMRSNMLREAKPSALDDILSVILEDQQGV